MNMKVGRLMDDEVIYKRLRGMSTKKVWDTAVDYIFNFEKHVKFPQILLY